MLQLRTAYRKIREFFLSGPGVILPSGSSLMEMPSFIPQGFRFGVEVLNDQATPMGFVVEALRAHVGLDKVDAVKAMLQIHETGGILLPLESAERANEAVEAIASDAARHGYPLACRAVSVTR